MKQVRGKTSRRSRGIHTALKKIHTALKNKQDAEARAAVMAPTFRKLMAAGFVSPRALANELNRRRIPAALGGSWHRSTLRRMLTRLGLNTKGTVNNGIANKKAADAHAKALASTIRALQVKGLASSSAIARELNAREIPAARGGKWHPSGVSRLLHRLAQGGRARPSSRHRR